MPIAYVLVFAVILFMLWTTYSQQRRAKKAAAELQRLLKKGDEVLTVGGMFGVIRKMGDDFVILEVESGARVKLLRRGIREILSEEDDDYPEDDDLDDEDAEYEEVDEDDYDEEDDESDVEEGDESADHAEVEFEAVDESVDDVELEEDVDPGDDPGGNIGPSAPTAPSPPDGR